MLTAASGIYSLVMSDKGEIKKHGETSHKDNSSVGLINYILGDHKRVGSNISTHDSWPNTDGDIEILTVEGVPLGAFRVQVKSLPEEHGEKYDFPIGLFKYVTEMSVPVMALLPDTKAGRVYWKYFDEDNVKNIKYTPKQQTKSLKLTKSQSFTMQEKAYIDEWVKIAEDRKNHLAEMRNALNELNSKDILRSKELIDTNHPSEALLFLEKMKDEKWDTLNPNEKFRVLTNIGVSQHLLGRNEDAAQNFIEAFSLEPTLDKAKANRALAHLLKGENKEGLKLVDNILATNPIDPTAAAIKVRAMYELGRSYTAIEKVLDPTVKESVEVIHALSYATRDNDTDKSIQLLKRAVEIDADNANLNADLGISLLQSVQKKWKGKIRGELSSEEKITVEEGIRYLELAWSKLQTDDDKRSQQNWLFNTIVGYRFLGNDCGLEKSLKELIDLDPNNKINIQEAAAIAVESGKYELAESYLKSAELDSDDTNTLSLMLSDSLILQEKYDAALAVIQRLVPKVKNDSAMNEHVSSNLFKILLDTGNLDAAQELSDSTSQNPETTALANIFKSRIAKVQQNEAQSIELLNQAAESLPKDPSKSLLYSIADDAFKLEQYALAATTYERIIDLNADSVEARRYLQSLYETKRYNTLIDRVRALAKKGFKSKQILRFEWAALIELQDLGRARKALIEYLKQNQSDEEEKLNVALIDFRTHNTRGLNKYLNEKIDLTNLSATSLTQLAQLYRIRDMIEKMLRVAYELRRRYPDDPQAHSAYIGSIIGLGNAGRKFLDADEVMPNTVIIYEGGYFIIEADYQPSINNHELSVEDAERRGFIGKKKGDLIVLSRNKISGDRTTPIIEIQTKYIHALHDSMKNYEQRFIDRDDLMGFNVKDEDFSPLLKQIDQTHDAATTAEELYNTGKLTIDLFAKYVGKNIIEVIYALRGTSHLGIKSSKGDSENEEKLSNALAKINKPRFIIDITALISFYELGLDASDIGIDSFDISQSTKDLVVQEAAKIKNESHQRGMTIYKQDDRYIRQEITSKERRERVKSINLLIKWIERNTKIRTFNEHLLADLSENKKLSQIEDVLLESQTDTMKLATNVNTILYTDDASIGALAKEVLGVESIWTQALLAYKVRAQDLGLLQYGELTIKLAEANLHHLGISPVILLQSVLKGGELFTSTLRALTRKEVEAQSMIVVASQFIELSVRRGLIDKIVELMPLILEGLISDHDKDTVIEALTRNITILLRDLGQDRESIIGAIHEWTQANQ